MLSGDVRLLFNCLSGRPCACRDRCIAPSKEITRTVFTDDFWRILDEMNHMHDQDART